MNIVIRSLIVCSLFGATPLIAQVGPEDTIKKILDEVGEEMREIDKLLLQSARSPATEGMERNVERLRDLMNQTGDSQGRVVRGLDQLIDELQKMSQSSSSSSSSSQDQQGEPQSGEQPQDGQPQGQQPQGERQQTETPDLVRQGEQQQPGEQPQGQQPQGQQPQDGQDPQTMGQNRPGGTVPEGGEEQVERAGEAERWGDLPKYIQLLHTRGGLPDVPEKYRRAYEAYQRRANQQGASEPR